MVCKEKPFNKMNDTQNTHLISPLEDALTAKFPSLLRAPHVPAQHSSIEPSTVAAPDASA